MAVKTVWTITHACGHDDDRDLSAKPADERANMASWLATKECTGCWRKAQNGGQEPVSKDAWLAGKRAEEAAARTAWEQSAQMGELGGSEKAVDWGTRVRHDLMSGAYENLVMNGDLSDEEWIETIEEPARQIDRASWWIDQREADHEDLAELVAAAQSTSAVSTENTGYAA